MIKFKKINYFLILSLFFVFLPLFSSAQNISTGNLLELDMSPRTPEPLKNVTFSLRSFTYDLDRAEITWLINDEIKKAEIGLKQFTTQAGKNGQRMTVTARIRTPDTTEERSRSFIPAGMDLLWEANSYVPPFYHGKALNPNQGKVTLWAVPNFVNSLGENIPSEEIIFNWKKDDKVQQSFSGIGKDSFSFTGTVPIRDVDIEVSASSFDNSIQSTKTIRLTNLDPKIIFYEEHPIYGLMFNRAIRNTVKMFTDEFKVRAFPYYLSVSNPNSPDLSYKWTFNGQYSDSLEGEKTAMVFRQENPGSGSAQIGLKIDNIKNIFQFADAKFVINFEKQ